MCTCLLRNYYVTVYVPDYVIVSRVLGSVTSEGSSLRSGRGRPPSLVSREVAHHLPQLHYYNVCVPLIANNPF